MGANKVKREEADRRGRIRTTAAAPPLLLLQNATSNRPTYSLPPLHSTSNAPGCCVERLHLPLLTPRMKVSQLPSLWLD
jgi:hypothetical protein